MIGRLTQIQRPLSTVQTCRRNHDQRYIPKLSETYSKMVVEGVLTLSSGVPRGGHRNRESEPRALNRLRTRE
jgi:hypothetical protein